MPNSLLAVSPIDGRYTGKTKELQAYFSEYALIKYRIFVELEYLFALSRTGVITLTDGEIQQLKSIYVNFSEDDAKDVKNIEKTTNHDVKAVEYFIKKKIDWEVEWIEFVHFGLTSQDINNTAFPLMLKEGLRQVIYPKLNEIIDSIKSLSKEYQGIPMLAKTHGQAASPTTLGKEMMVFVERLEMQQTRLQSLPICAKFGGATGNLNAHKLAYPDIDWRDFSNQFVTESLGLHRLQFTTQIAHYDHMAAIFDALARINVILIDFARDVWTYISMDYFKQKVVANEVGSSAMPHKVNPIDFENAEGNLGIANAILSHLSSKLPISRLQRDLTDSTVLRNIGVPMGHILIAFKSLDKGISKLKLNQTALDQDLINNYAVIAEAIQTILRRENYPKPYEALKSLTRGKASLTKDDFDGFIESLDISDSIKAELKQVEPRNYIGYIN